MPITTPQIPFIDVTSRIFSKFSKRINYSTNTDVPIVSTGKDHPSSTIIFERWIFNQRDRTSNIHLISELPGENIIWIHHNTGNDYHENSIILSDTHIFKMERSVLVSKFPISDIRTLVHQDNGHIRWNKLLINPHLVGVDKDEIGIKSSSVIDCLIDLIDKLKRYSLTEHSNPSEIHSIPPTYKK